jgi:hypothetical protein
VQKMKESAKYVLALAGACFACLLAPVGDMNQHPWISGLLGAGIPAGIIAGLLLTHGADRSERGWRFWWCVIAGTIIPGLALACWTSTFNRAAGTALGLSAIVFGLLAFIKIHPPKP